MDNKQENKSLIKVENNSLKVISNKLVPKIVDGTKRTLKILSWGSVAFLGLGALAIGNVPVATVGLITSLGASFRTFQNMLYKTEPSLMFMSKVKGGERQIFQDVRLNLASKMKDYNAVEKGGMMALQTLVGFSRWKENLKYSDFEIGENGEKIYLQKISTVTHGINLKTLQMIEDLGYIKIDSMEDKFRYNVVDKVLGRNPRGLQKLLIVEKLGFRNYSDLKKILKAGVKRDKDTLDSMRKNFSKVTFRLTDKPIDFEELYMKSCDLNKVEDKKERIALKRLSIIFDNKQGILATKNIDIGKDAFGRNIIKYGTPQSFGKRVQQNLFLNDEKTQFHEYIKEDVNSKGLEARAIKSLNEQAIVDKKEEREKE